MLLIEILRLALASLNANKLRSSLTVLGISVGIFSVIGVMTVIAGLRGQVEANLTVLGSASFQINKYPAINFSDPRERFRNRRDITYPMADRFKEQMGDSAKINLTIWRRGLRVVNGDKKTNPNTGLVGTDENFSTSRNYEIANGRNLSPEDVALGRPVCVIGDEVARVLFPNENPLGRNVRVGGQNFNVVGQFAPKGTSFGQSQDNFIVTPITRWLAIYGRQWRSIGITVQAPSQDELGPTQDKAIGLMRQVRGLDPEDPNDFEIFSNDSLIESFNKIADIISIGAFVISAIALLAAGVGVMNIMLVSVTERTKEIGVRKSIGAKQKNILMQFLIEAVALSLVGGLVGVAIGVGGGIALALFMKGALVFPWVWVAVGLLVCGGIGVIFGFYPAWKAARLDPIEALRYE
ncbi:MAG: ABC transporter permease [Nibricoccus sp.]